MTLDEFDRASTGEKFDYLFSSCQAARQATNNLSATLQRARQQIADLEDQVSKIAALRPDTGE
jgi:ABC-type phosphate transport system auxiliary subunit